MRKIFEPMTLRQPQRSRFAWLLLAALLAVVVTAHVRWIRADATFMPHVDSYSLLSRTLQLLNDLGQPEPPTPARLGRLVDATSLAGRPPLYQLVSAPGVALLGRDQDAAQLSNLLYLIVLGGATFLLGREVGRTAVGLLAAALVVTYPPIVQLVAVYRPHAAFPALAALLLWLVARVVRRRRAADVWGVAGVLAAAAWIHPAFAFFAAAPVGVLLVHLARKPPAAAPAAGGEADPAADDRAALWRRAVLPAFAAAAVLVLVWYATGGQEIVRDFLRWKAMSVAADPDAERVRSGFRDVPANALWYLRTSPHVLTWFHVFLAAAGTVAALATRRIALVLLVLHVVVGYALQAIVDNGLHWYRIAALLPAVAVLSAHAVFALRGRALRAVLAAAALAVGAFCLVYVLFGRADLDRAARGLGAPVDTVTCQKLAWRSFALCARPPLGEPPRTDQVVGLVADQPVCRPPRRCRVMVVQRTGLLPGLLLTSAEQRWPDHRIRFHGIGTRRLGGRFAFEALLGSDLVVYVDGRSRGANYSTDAERFLRSRATVYARRHREIGRVELSTGLDAVLLERTAPLTVAEVEDALARLPVDEEAREWARGFAERREKGRGRPAPVGGLPRRSPGGDAASTARGRRAARRTAVRDG